MRRADVDTRAKLIAAGLLMIAAFVSPSIAGGALLVLVVAMVLGTAHIGMVQIRGPLITLASIAVMLVCVQSLFGGVRTVEVLPGISIEHRLAPVAVRVAQMTVVLLLALAVTSTSGSSRLALALCDLLAPLRLMRVPVEELGLAIALALTWVPTMGDQIGVLRAAQQARGVDRDRTLAVRIRADRALAVPLFIHAFRRSRQVADAMHVRGYRYGVTRTRFERERGGAVDVLLVVVAACVSIGAVLL